MTHGQQGSYHFVYQHFELDTSFILRYIGPFLFIYLFCMSVNRVRWVARRVLYFSLVTKQQCLFAPFVTLSNFFRYRRSVLQILLSFWTLINVCVKERCLKMFTSSLLCVQQTLKALEYVSFYVAIYIRQTSLNGAWNMQQIWKKHKRTKKKKGNSCTLSWPFPFQTWLMLISECNALR